jgi:hypothetical protein
MRIVSNKLPLPRAGLIRCGMAALETVMIIGAMLPVTAVLFFAIRYALRLIHSLIANLTGSPLL